MPVGQRSVVLGNLKAASMALAAFFMRCAWRVILFFEGVLRFEFRAFRGSAARGGPAV
jgi:hypothetical protein